MENLIFGIDLCDDYTQIAWTEPGMAEPQPIVFGEGDHPTMIATAVCRLKEKKEWVIGEDAARYALFGAGSIVDKLIKQIDKDGTATMEGIRYTAEDLMLAFLETSLKKSVEYVRSVKEGADSGISDSSENEAEGLSESSESSELEEDDGVSQTGKETEEDIIQLPPLEESDEIFDGSCIQTIVFSLQNPDLKLMDTLMRCMGKLGIPSERVFMQTHSESLAYYTAGQKLDLWANDVGLFDLTRAGLYFYRFSCVRGTRPAVIRVEETRLEEGFSLDLLDTVSGRKLADSILGPCAQRLLTKKVYSSIFLGGTGFDECENWAGEFLKVICSKRHVFQTENLFAKGACACALDKSLPQSRFPYRIVCKGRLNLSVSVQALLKGNPVKATLVANGTNWYEAKAEADFLVNGKEPLELLIEGEGRQAPPARKIPISLADFPAREGFTTRVRLSIVFHSENVIRIEAEDLGFGMIFPGSGRISRQEVTLNWIG